MAPAAAFDFALGAALACGVSLLRSLLGCAWVSFSSSSSIFLLVAASTASAISASSTLGFHIASPTAAAALED